MRAMHAPPWALGLVMLVLHAVMNHYKVLGEAKLPLFVPSPADSAGEPGSIAGVAVAAASDDVLAFARAALEVQPQSYDFSDDEENATCWAVLTDWPRRSCTLKQNICQVTSIAQADSCRFCARGA